MKEISTLNNEQIKELAINTPNTLISTNESVKQAKPKEVIDLYLYVFKMAYSKIEERIKEKNKIASFFDVSDLGANKIL